VRARGAATRLFAQQWIDTGEVRRCTRAAREARRRRRQYAQSRHKRRASTPIETSATAARPGEPFRPLSAPAAVARTKFAASVAVVRHNPFSSLNIRRVRAISDATTRRHITDVEDIRCVIMSE
jgi:hypothetical protein